jgi:hypothetical protein
MIREDYIERLIQQFAAAFKALLKAREEQRPEDVLKLIRETSLSLLGMEYSALTLADAASTARLLGHPLRIVGLARLVVEEGELLRAQGKETRASLRWSLALELFLEARALGAELQGEDARVFTRLRTEVVPSVLSERYQRMLADSSAHTE